MVSVLMIGRLTRSIVMIGLGVGLFDWWVRKINVWGSGWGVLSGRFDGRGVVQNVLEWNFVLWLWFLCFLTFLTGFVARFGSTIPML